VTASVDSVAFRSPIKVGQLVTFLASVNCVGRSSMEVGIKILAEDLITRAQTHTNSCYFTLVALDPNGRPKAVPKLILETSEDKRRNAQATERRAFRLKHRS
jgi:acyl-CoA hydrolase